MAARRYTAPETGVVRIRTDAGIEGLGDGATLPHYLGHGIGSMVDWMGRFNKVLIGADPLNIAGVHRRMEAVAGIGRQDVDRPRRPSTWQFTTLPAKPMDARFMIYSVAHTAPISSFKPRCMGTRRNSFWT